LTRSFSHVQMPPILAYTMPSQRLISPLTILRNTLEASLSLPVIVVFAVSSRLICCSQLCGRSRPSFVAV
jgi:hypothetical protein